MTGNGTHLPVEPCSNLPKSSHRSFTMLI